MERNANRLALGVQNGLCRKQKLNIFLNEETSVTKKFCFKKPTCSLLVLLRLVLSHSEGMTAMEAWKSIRMLFPYFSKCHTFTLRAIRHILKSSKDIEQHPSSCEGDESKGMKFRLSQEVQFCYKVEDIIGEGTQLKLFTRDADQFYKCLQRSSIQQERETISEPRLQMPPLPSKRNSNSVTLSPFSTSSPNLISHSLVKQNNKKRQRVPKQNLLRKLMKKYNVRPVSWNVERSFHANPAPIRSMNYFNSVHPLKQLRGSKRPNNAKTSIHLQDSNKYGNAKRKRGVVKHQIDLLDRRLDGKLSDDESPRYANSCSRQLSNDMKSSLSCSSDSMPLLGSKFSDGSTDRQFLNKSSLSCSSDNDRCSMPLLGNYEQMDYLRLARNNLIPTSKDTYPITKSQPVIHSVFEKSTLESNKPASVTFSSDGNIDILGLLGDQYETHLDIFTNCDNENRINSTSIVNTSEPENRIDSTSIAEKTSKPCGTESEPEIVYVKQENPSPDSTDTQPFNSFVYDATEAEDRKRKTNTEDLSLPQKVPKCSKQLDAEDLVSSSTSPSLGKTIDDEITIESEHFSCDSEASQDVIVDEITVSILDNKIEFNILKKKYDWLTYDKEKDNLCCFCCDYMKVTSCFTALCDVERVLSEHNSSLLHSLFPLTKSGRLVDGLYHHLLKMSAKCIKSRSHLFSEIIATLSSYDIQNVDEEMIIKLLKFYEQYIENKVICRIRNENSPFSVTLNFCSGTAILRSVNALHSPYECVMNITNLVDKSVVGFINSVNLNVNNLLYFTVWPTCGTCNECFKNNVRSENSSYSIPSRRPGLEELLEFVQEDPYVFPYFNFVSELKSLYKKYPHCFVTIKDVCCLRNKYFWQLCKFVDENITTFREICLNLFKKYGETVALALSVYALEIDTRLKNTLKMIDIFIGEYKDIERLLNDCFRGMNTDKRSIIAKLERLKTNISQYEIQTSVKDLLYDFTKAIIEHVSFKGWENVLWLCKLCDVSILKKIKSMPSQQLLELQKAFVIFEKFMPVTFDNLTVELQSFGHIVSSRFPESPSVPFAKQLTILHKDAEMKTRFSSVSKFYSLILTLPIFPKHSHNHSDYVVNTTLKLLSKKLGSDLAGIILPVIFDETPKDETTAATYLKERIFNPP